MKAKIRRVPPATNQPSFRSSWPALRAAGRSLRSHATKRNTNISILRAAALVAVTVLSLSAASLAAPTVRHIAPRPLPTPRLPNVPLHTEFKVEVNHMGQIVRVKSGKESKFPDFNAMTYGNVLQMFIRKPDGTAVVGMYRITFDYDPNTKKVHRGIELLSRGGDWGDEQGAVNQMLEVDKKNRERHRALPGMNELFRPTPSPSPKPHR